MALFSRRKDSPEAAESPFEQAEAGGSGTAEPSLDARSRRRRTVGQMLRDARESYGSDIPRVAAALRIRAAYLEAIEQGRYDGLPGPVYALGFVRAYAVHLGLDGEEAVRRFKLEAEGLEGQRDLSFPVPLAERSIPGGAMLLAALILAVCGYGLWYYLSSTARPRIERVSAVPAELAKMLPNAKPAAAPKPAAPAPAASAPAAPSAAPSAAPASAGAPAPAEAPIPSPAAQHAVPAAPAASAPASPPAAAPPPAAPAAAAPASPPAPAASPAGAPAHPAAPSAAQHPASAAEAVPPPPPASGAAAVATATLPPLPPQTAGAPAIPPTAGATPVPDEPRVYGLANGDTRIVIHATGDSWVQIRDAEHVPIFTRELHAGDSYRVPDRPGLTMRTGRGMDLDITVDGRHAPPIGGAVRPEVLLDPDRLLAGTAVQ